MSDGPAPRRTSPWVYVGIGCAVVLVLGSSALVAVGWFGYRKVRELQAEMKDPDARLGKALGVLGADSLPPGYHPIVAFSVPLVLDVAVLSDTPLPEGEDAARSLGARGYIYTNVLNTGQDYQELRDYFEGRTDDAGVLRRNRINIRPRQVLRRGSFELDGATVLYLAQRGEVAMSHGHGEGITSLLFFECPGDSRMRIGIWFGPDPTPGRDASGAADAAPSSAPATTAEDPDGAPGADPGEVPTSTPARIGSPATATDAELAGTTADPAAMREFVSHFDPCGLRRPK